MGKPSPKLKPSSPGSNNNTPFLSLRSIREKDEDLTGTSSTTWKDHAWRFLSVSTAKALLLMLVSSSTIAAASSSKVGLRDSIEQNVMKGELQRELQTCDMWGPFETASSYFDMLGGQMLCAYPTNTDLKFPLLSLAHGTGAGGWNLGSYLEFMLVMASTGFVICAPEHCWFDCLDKMDIYQLNAITSGKYYGERGELPVRREGTVGLLGHSSGGVSTLHSCYPEYVSKYDIGAAMTYDATGAAIANEKLNADLNLSSVDPSIPLFVAKGGYDVDVDKDWDHIVNDTETLLSVNPNRSLLTASIDGMEHNEMLTSLFHWYLTLKAVPYIIAFFTYTLKPSGGCCEESKNVLGMQLKLDSTSYYDDHLIFPCGSPSD
jgi:hypothetical protein